MMMLIAEFELDRIRESWGEARKRAIARGVHITRIPPFGFKRNGDGRLHPDPKTAPIVKELFERRASGDTWQSIIKWLDGVAPQKTWTRQSVGSMVRNRAYLGEARSGESLNADAHEPIVGVAEFEAAQLGTKLSRGGRSGSLLAGLIRCEACGHNMTHASAGARLSSDGNKYHFYKCGRRHADGACPAPTKISTKRADSYVIEQYLARWREHPRAYEGAEREDEKAQAQTALKAAETELEVYRDAAIAAIGKEAYIAGLQKRQQAVDNARAALAQVSSSELLPVTGDESLGELWQGLDERERHTLLAAAIDKITVRRGKGGPIEERLEISWT
jgi:site-specific DNA recombinase